MVRIAEMGENTKTFVAALLVFLAIMLVSAYVLGPKVEERTLVAMREGPITKNAQLGLEPGEEYAYLFSSTGYNATITYRLWQRPTCLAVAQKELDIPDEVCINDDGTDKSGSNFSFSDPTVFFFRPWMLAIEDGWGWNVTLAGQTAAPGSGYTITLRETGETVYLNRSAYAIEVAETGSKARTTLFVDKEKRVLLKEEGPGYSVEIISAPFPLAQSAE